MAELGLERNQKQILANSLCELERSNFCDFEKSQKRAGQKKKIESIKHNMEEGSRYKLTKNRRVSNRIKNHGKLDSGLNSSMVNWLFH